MKKDNSNKYIRLYRQMRREKQRALKEERELFFPFSVSFIRGGYFGTLTKSYFSLGEALHDI